MQEGDERRSKQILPPGLVDVDLDSRSQHPPVCSPQRPPSQKSRHASMDFSPKMPSTTFTRGGDLTRTGVIGFLPKPVRCGSNHPLLWSPFAVSIPFFFGDAPPSSSAVFQQNRMGAAFNFTAFLSNLSVGKRGSEHDRRKALVVVSTEIGGSHRRDGGCKPSNYRLQSEHD